VLRRQMVSSPLECTRTRAVSRRACCSLKITLETYSAEDGDAEVVDHLPQQLGAEKRRSVEEDEGGTSLQA
jgi:hypothetical protein